MCVYIDVYFYQYTTGQHSYTICGLDVCGSPSFPVSDINMLSLSVKVTGVCFTQKPDAVLYSTDSNMRG